MIKRNHIRYAIIVLLGGAIIWLYTPVPTALARYAWEHYRAGSLTLLLDRSDTFLSFAVGNYYFGNQSSIGMAGEHPYDLSLAKKAFEKTMKINPSIAIAHYMRARIEFIQADFDAALADLDTELALYQTNMRTLYMRGLVYAYRGREGDLTLAENDFRTFVAWAPTEWAGYNDLAFVLAKEKKYADAEKILKEGIAKAKGGATNPWFWNALGVMELNLNKPMQALASLGEAQKLAESLTDVDWQRAYPGNDPATAEAGLKAMKSSIARNIIKAYSALGK